MTSRARFPALAAVILLALAGLAGLGQQALRQPANHPQAEMAATAVSQLDVGASPSAVVPTKRIDLAQSQEPFVIVVDSQRTVLASSASLGGEVVLPPQGVFDRVRMHGEDRLTWSPAAGVRSWIVVDSFHGGFVVAGRSPGGGEQTAYLLIFWGSIAALGLAVIAAAGLVLTR